MSGHPLRNPTDADEYRQKYLDYLDIQIDNDEKNLQANLLHKRTGQVASQITDYSTTSQKLANMYALRIELKKQLRRICVAEDADLVVQGLNDAEVRFANNYIEKLIAEIRPKFKYGAPEPYVSQYIRRVFDIEQESQGFPVEDMLRAIISRMGRLPTKTDLDGVKSLMARLTERTNRDFLEPIKEDIEKTAIMVDAIGNIVRIISEKPDIDPEILPSIREIVLGATQDLPTNAQMIGIVQSLERVKGDNVRTRELLGDLHQLLAQNPEDIALLKRAIEGLNEAVGDQRRRGAEDVEVLRQATGRLARGVELGIGAVREDIGDLRQEQVNLGRAVSAIEDRLNIRLTDQQLRVVDEMVKARATLGTILDRLARLEEEGVFAPSVGQPAPAPSREVIPEQRGVEAYFPAEKPPEGALKAKKRLPPPEPLDPTSAEFKEISRKDEINKLTNQYKKLLH